MKLAALAIVGLAACGPALAQEQPAKAEAPAQAAAACPPLFNAEEVRAMIQLLDMGVKFGGIGVAGSADYLARKLQQPPAPAGK